MSAAEMALYQSIRSRAAAAQPELAKRLLAAYDIIRRSLNERELAEAISSGTFQSTLDQLMSDDVLDPALAPLRALVDQTVLDAARTTKLPPHVKPPAFNVLNPKIIEAAVKLDTQVIQSLKTEIRESVRQTVVRGIQAGTGPREVARTVRAQIGLPPAHAEWVGNFRRQLETGDRAALNRALGKRDLATLDRKLGGDGLTTAQIDRMTEAYERKLHALNAETVTRTMALDAQRAGQRGSWEDAIGQGMVDRSRLSRVWVSVGDGRVRPEHVAMNGTKVGWDQTYPNGEMVPGDSTYNCRCIERVVIGSAA